MLRGARRADAPPLLDPLAALEAAIARARAELPAAGARAHREHLVLAAGDVLRALVWARRRTADLESEASAALHELARAVGEPVLPEAAAALGLVEAAPTTAIDDEATVRVNRERSRAERLDETMDAAHRAVAALRVLERMPLSSRDAIVAGVGDMTRTLARVRRCLRALGSELSALEAESRELVVAVLGRRHGQLAGVRVLP